MRPLRTEGAVRTAPALVVLVEGHPRLLVDARSGTLDAARAASLELGQLSTVVLSSMRPTVTAELPELLADARGPSGTVRLVAPLDRAWPSPSRWAEALFGPSGLYPAPRAAPRSLRIQPVTMKPGIERRLALEGGTELRSRTSSASGTPAVRVTRGDAVLVLAGEVAPEAVGDLTALASGAGLLVASVPTRASVQTLAEVARTGRPRRVLITAAGEEVRSSLDEASKALAGEGTEVTWASAGRYPVLAARPASLGEEAPAGCKSDQECGPGRVCMGCGDGPRECIQGCRSKTDCPTGQACIQAQCIRCPCPAQCTGG